MAFSQILLILSPPIDAPAAEATVARALATAAHPAEVCFALPSALESVFPTLSALWYADQWQDVLPQLNRETHFLLLSGAHAFVPKWDAVLLRLLRGLPPRTLLTSVVSPAPVQAKSEPFTEDAPTRRASPLHAVAPMQNADTALPQAYLPALKESLSDTEVALGRGLPLVCASQPIRTLLVNPDCVFGPISFLLESDLHPEALSQSAYVHGYSVFALHRLVLWPIAAAARRTLVRSSMDALPSTTLSRFEQLLGFRSGQPRVQGKASMGLFTPQDTYPQQMPIALQMLQKRRTLSLRLRERPLPLLVSAITDLSALQRTPIDTRLRFGFLQQIECLPLLLYTAGSQERNLRRAFPNTHSYPEQKLLPRSLLLEGMKPQEHFDRSKALLLQHAAQRHIEFSHVAWIDPDSLPHPICREAVPDFLPLMDDRIHIATVNGVPDASLILIPTKLLAAVARLAQSITQLDAELKRGFGEALLWERIFVKKPEWFSLHPMPKQQLLFLSLLDPPLVSRSLQKWLAKLEPAYNASQADVPARKQPPKEVEP